MDELKHQPNLLRYFLGARVLLEAEGYTCVGKLIRYELGNKNRGIPTVLILKSLANRRIIVNYWSVIKRKQS